MIKSKITGLISALLFLIFTGCYEDSNDSKKLLLLMPTSSLIENMSQSTLEMMSDGMSEINTSGVTNLSYRIYFPEMWQKNRTIGETFCTASGKMLDSISAYAATNSCPGGGSFDYTDVSNTWLSDNSSFYVTRTFNQCKGPYGLFEVSGQALLYWTGLNGAGVYGVAKLKAGSKIEQAPVNKRFTRVATGNYITVEGNGSQLSHDGLSGNIAHTINWSSVNINSRSFTLNTDLTRKGYTSNGSLIFEHNVITPSPIQVSVDLVNQIRTVNSGTVRVEYTQADVTMESTINNLQIPMDSCVPSSGTISITLSGSRSGSGSITYTGNGTASYTYVNSRGNTISGTFQINGCQ